MSPGGFEPPTNGLQNRCSTPELTRPILRRRPACAPAGKIAHHIASSPAEQRLGETGKRDRIVAFLAPERPEPGRENQAGKPPPDSCNRITVVRNLHIGPACYLRART